MRSSTCFTDTQEAQESWAGWALSFIPSLGSYAWDEEWNNGQQASGNYATTHIGFYVDDASITFKVSLPHSVCINKPICRYN